MISREPRAGKKKLMESQTTCGRRNVPIAVNTAVTSLPPSTYQDRTRHDRRRKTP